MPHFICLSCNGRSNTLKKLDIVNPSRTIVLHLVRFKGLEKIQDSVRFPLQLGLTHVRLGSEQKMSYLLKGVIVHVGESIASGHYYAYVYTQDK